MNENLLQQLTRLANSGGLPDGFEIKVDGDYVWFYEPKQLATWYLRHENAHADLLEILWRIARAYRELGITFDVTRDGPDDLEIDAYRWPNKMDNKSVATSGFHKDETAALLEALCQVAEYVAQGRVRL